ncbi:MAG: toll/interleukin-1 receptor domain-containing protein [Planctomycetes bacterium]|nr:toll/interleukin-1 receptor domain-containing protein [Planctomycetota bacterium]
MAYLTRSELQGFRSYGFSITEAKRYQSTARATVFLSHSHKDKDLVEPAIAALLKQGVVVYVDWKDPTMPEATSPKTAAAIKVRIKECRKFVLLASDNGLTSKWVPWELGIADSQNGMDSVVILPVTDDPRTWPGSEYVGIYDRIERKAGEVLVVVKPGQGVYDGISLAEWLRR